MDANVLVGELLRKRGREMLSDGALKLVISEKARDEA